MNKIPGYKSEGELEFISNIVSQLPENSIIIEIGAAVGRVTWEMSEHATNGTEIFAIDSWCGKHRYAGNGYFLDNSKWNTYEYFTEYMSSKIGLNVIPFKGDSLEMNLKIDADLILVDPDNGKGKTDLYQHIKKWFPFLKTTGIMVGFNYFEHRDDVRNDVDKFAEEMNLSIHIDSTGGWWYENKT